MFKKSIILLITLIGLTQNSMAASHLDLINLDSKDIKYYERNIGTEISSSYEFKTEGDFLSKYMESLNNKKAYNNNYLNFASTYEFHLRERALKDDWAIYSPTLTMIYPDPKGKKIISSLYLDVPIFYQNIIFFHNKENRYEMREKFLNKIINKNCSKLKYGISEVNKEDWKDYINFIENLGSSITFKFSNNISLTVLTICKNIDWKDYLD